MVYLSCVVRACREVGLRALKVVEDHNLAPLVSTTKSPLAPSLEGKKST